MHPGSILQPNRRVVNKYPRYQGLLLALVFIGSLLSTDETRAQAFTYQYINQSLSGVNFGDADWGDVDLDGDLDLVIAGLTKGEVQAPFATVSKADAVRDLLERGLRANVGGQPAHD